MPRPRRYTLRTRTLVDGRSATYARFTDQHGVRREPLLDRVLAQRAGPPKSRAAKSARGWDRCRRT